METGFKINNGERKMNQIEKVKKFIKEARKNLLKFPSIKLTKEEILILDDVFIMHRLNGILLIFNCFNLNGKDVEKIIEQIFKDCKISRKLILKEIGRISFEIV